MDKKLDAQSRAELLFMEMNNIPEGPIKSQFDDIDLAEMVKDRKRTGDDVLNATTKGALDTQDITEIDFEIDDFFDNKLHPNPMLEESNTTDLFVDADDLFNESLDDLDDFSETSELFSESFDVNELEESDLFAEDAPLNDEVLDQIAEQLNEFVESLDPEKEDSELDALDESWNEIAKFDENATSEEEPILDELLESDLDLDAEFEEQDLDFLSESEDIDSLFMESEEDMTDEEEIVEENEEEEEEEDLLDVEEDRDHDGVPDAEEPHGELPEDFEGTHEDAMELAEKHEDEEEENDDELHDIEDEETDETEEVEEDEEDEELPELTFVDEEDEDSDENESFDESLFI